MSSKKDLDPAEFAEWKAAEYKEVCSDWRLRDGMLWQSLAVAIAGTGLALSNAVGGDLPPIVQAGLFFLALVLNLLVLLKIVKDNYLQHGSSELLQKLAPEGALHKIGVTEGTSRLHPPSDDYSDGRLKKVRPRWLYKWLRGQSTFATFFAVQSGLVLFNGLAFLWALANHAAQLF